MVLGRVCRVVVVLGVVFGGLAVARPALAVTHVPATTYSVNTTWTAAGSPYVLDGSVTVASGATLTVEPGVIVKLNGQFRTLTVNGAISAVGTAASRIVFTSLQDDSVGGDTGSDGPTVGAPGQWYSLAVAAGLGSRFSYVDVLYGGYGSANWNYGEVGVSGSGTLFSADHSSFQYSGSSGVLVGSGATVNLSADTLSHNGNGASVNTGTVAISGQSMISNNSQYGVWFNLPTGYSTPASSIVSSDVTGNGSTGILIGANGDYPLSQMPWGSGDNVYANAGKQLDTSGYPGFLNAAVNWLGNYWGSDVYYWYNAAVCRGASPNANGHLAYRSSTGDPPAGPVGSSVYLDSSYTTLCGRDNIAIGPNDFSPFYLDGSASEPLYQTLGDCGVDEDGDDAAVNATACEGDVNAATGGFNQAFTDLSMPGIGLPFTFTRTYNSLDLAPGPLGVGWTHSYASSLGLLSNGDIAYRSGTGQQVYFTKTGSSYSPAPGSRATLSTISGGYELLTYSQLRERFDTSGRLTAMTERNGKGLSFAYDGNGRLATITDSGNRQISLTYDATSGLLTRVALPDNRNVQYGYSSGRLSSVTDPRGGVTTYTYENHSWLSKATDALQHTIFENTYGADGRVLTAKDGLGNTTSFSWDPATQTQTTTDAGNHVWKDVFANNLLKKKIDPLNDVTDYGYDSDLNQTSVKDARGNTTATSYDSRGNMLTRTAPAPLSYQESWTYNAANDVTSYTNGRGKTTSYAYDSNGNLTSLAQPGNVVTQYARDPAGSGLLISSTDPRGKTTTYTYDAQGNQLSVTTPLGHKTTYVYDTTGRMTSSVAPKGNVTGADPTLWRTSYTYDNADHKLSDTDRLVNPTSYTYDAVGNLKTVTNALSKTWTYDYDPANRRTKETGPNSEITQTAYDALGHAISVTSPLNEVTSYGYDAAGRRTTMVEARGNVQGANPADFTTTYGYDAAGNPTSIADPLGDTTSYGYDALNRKVSATDPRGKTTAYVYDGANNLTSVTDPENRTTSYAYDDLNRQTSLTDARGKTTSFEYDAAGNRTAIVAPLGGRTTLAYDDDGRLNSTVAPRGNVQGADPDQYKTTNSYDEDGNLTVQTDPLGNTTGYAYDRLDRRTSTTDANNHAVSWTYDALGRLTKTTDPASQDTNYAYDDRGNLISRTDANTHVTTYSYDLDNRRTQLTSPGPHSWAYSYDPAGHLTKLIDANGNSTIDPNDGTTNYSYDRAGRLTAIDFSDTTPDVSFGYDAAGNRTSMSDGASTSYTWTDANRLATVTRGSNVFSYAYDANGAVSSRTYPDNTTTAYTYDDDGRLATAASGGNATSYAYDADGNVTSVALPAANGYLAQLAYDRAGRLSSIANTKAGSTLSSFAYTRDPAGNPTRIDKTGGAAETYTYDSNDRITEACYQTTACSGSSDPFIRWTYDAVGNRLTEARPTGTTSYSYDANDQLTQRTGLGGTVNYSYDQNGNETAAGARTFSYDLANRLASTTASGVTATDSYDGDGNRLQEAISGGTTTNFLWDTNFGLPQLALERDGTGALLRRYIYGADALSFNTGSADFYYHYDGLGSVTNVTDASGATQWTYSYEPFGSPRTQNQNSPTAPANPLRFTGEYLGGQGDLYNLRARQYDPSTGRFLSTDPQPPAATHPYISPYAYADNQPTVQTDPSGLDPRIGGSTINCNRNRLTCSLMYGAGYPKDNNCGGRCIGRMLRMLGNRGIDFSQLLAVAKGQGKLLNATEAAQGPGIYFVSQRSGPKKIEPPKDPSCGALCSVGFATQRFLGCKTQTGCVAQAAMFFLPVGELRAGLRAEKGALQATRGGRTAEEGLSGAELLAREADSRISGDLSAAGRALAKHGGRPGSAFPAASGSPSAISNQASGIVRDILGNETRRVEFYSPRLKTQVVDIYDATGRGLRYSKQGDFIGFLEPRR